MSMQFADIGDILKISMSGRLDSANVDHLEIMFTAKVVPTGRNAMVDMAEVEFLASLGIRMFISTARALSRSGAQLVLYGANEAVMDVIETTALADLIPVFASESEAVAFINA